jgi:hypothetical protein
MRMTPTTMPYRERRGCRRTRRYMDSRMHCRYQTANILRSLGHQFAFQRNKCECVSNGRRSAQFEREFTSDKLWLFIYVFCFPVRGLFLYGVVSPTIASWIRYAHICMEFYAPTLLVQLWPSRLRGGSQKRQTSLIASGRQWR